MGAHHSGVVRKKMAGFEAGGIVAGGAQQAAAAQSKGPIQIKNSGLIPGATHGRADSLVVSLPADSYIFPADVVSALGDGNSEAGGRTIDAMIGQRGGGPQAQPPGPAGPAMPPQGPAGGIVPPQAGPMPMRAGGGKAAPQTGKPVTIRISGGEYAMMPSDVALMGQGDLEHGHDVLVKFTEQVRQNYAKKVKNLPSPKE